MGHPLRVKLNPRADEGSAVHVLVQSTEASFTPDDLDDGPGGVRVVAVAGVEDSITNVDHDGTFCSSLWMARLHCRDLLPFLETYLNLGKHQVRAYAGLRLVARYPNSKTQAQRFGL